MSDEQRHFTHDILLEIAKNALITGDMELFNALMPTQNVMKKMEGTGYMSLLDEFGILFNAVNKKVIFSLLKTNLERVIAFQYFGSIDASSFQSFLYNELNKIESDSAKNALTPDWDKYARYIKVFCKGDFSDVEKHLNNILPLVHKEVAARFRNTPTGAERQATLQEFIGWLNKEIKAAEASAEAVAKVISLGETSAKETMTSYWDGKLSWATDMDLQNINVPTEWKGIYEEKGIEAILSLIEGAGLSPDNPAFLVIAIFRKDKQLAYYFLANGADSTLPPEERVFSSTELQTPGAVLLLKLAQTPQDRALDDIRTAMLNQQRLAAKMPGLYGGTQQVFIKPKLAENVLNAIFAFRNPPKNQGLLALFSTATTPDNNVLSACIKIERMCQDASISGVTDKILYQGINSLLNEQQYGFLTSVSTSHAQFLAILTSNLLRCGYTLEKTPVEIFGQTTEESTVKEERFFIKVSESVAPVPESGVSRESLIVSKHLPWFKLPPPPPVDNGLGCVIQ